MHSNTPKSSTIGEKDFHSQAGLELSHVADSGPSRPGDTSEEYNNMPIVNSLSQSSVSYSTRSNDPRSTGGPAPPMACPVRSYLRRLPHSNAFRVIRVGGVTI